MNVLAVIVTYNRRAYLARCIDHVLAQTYPVSHLLVVNNGSTDDTIAMLEEKGIDFITQPNLGGAAGFERGIAYCLEQKYDAVWLMDDDGYPDAAALETLVQAMRPGVACVSSVVLKEDAPSEFVFPFPVLDSDGLPVLFARRRKVPTLAELKRVAGGTTYPFAHFFNGCLISRTSITAVGNVRREYVIFGDEVDYQMRLRRFGAVLSHLEAYHFHPDVSSRPMSDLKFYYYVKNTMILNRLYFNKVLARNIVAILAGLGRTAARNGPLLALSYLAGRQRKVLWRAVVKGLRGELGRDM